MTKTDFELFDFSSFDESVSKNSSASYIKLRTSSEECLHEKSSLFNKLDSAILKIIFAFGILNFGHCDLFGILGL